MDNQRIATPEIVWALLQEVAQAQKETDKQLKETDKQLKESSIEFDRRMKNSEEELKLWRKDFKQSTIEFDRRMKNLDERMGSWANNHGLYAEEYFFNSFENGKQNFFGEKFDDIEKNVKGINKGCRDEYDILLVNGKSVGIVEIKFKAHKNDIPKILRKAETFRINFPDYQKHKIYLGLATMVFYPELEQECIEHGIAIIKQIGDTVIINDDHLKVF